MAAFIIVSMDTVNKAAQRALKWIYLTISNHFIFCLSEQGKKMIR